jgi:cytochrome b involved in lipid metabolism
MKKTLTSQQAWLIRDTWKELQPLVSSKGFGGLQKMKKEVGMPVGSRDDHHDITETSLSPSTSKEELEELWKELGSDYPFTVTFYKHLFENNDQMRELFWRFNLFQSLEKIFNILNIADELEEPLRALAERHRGRGIVNADYDRIGVSLRHAFYSVSELNLTEKAKEAWLSAWDVFSQAMKVYDEPPSTSAETEEEVKELPSFTLEQVSEHKTKEDLWTAIDGKVYNLTQFVASHPGGDKILLVGGREGSKLFHNKFHSPRATTALAKYQIGVLVDNELK